MSYTGAGDFDVYCFNGVVVPQWLAETRGTDIDLERYTELENADVKAEFVRKVGIERFVKQGKLMDTYEKYDKTTHEWWHKSEYELFDMSFLYESLDYCPYLAMVNQTSGVFHLEGVSPECRDLPAAVRERFGRDMTIVGIA